MKVIFHLDLDSYFVSAHRAIDPSLINKAAVISDGKKRSIISAASYEAKDRGVFVPMPFFKAKKLCPDLITIKPNFKLYTSLSNKLFEFISQKYTKKIEVGSVDECYIDVSDIWDQYGSPWKLAHDMQKNILEVLKLPASIGVARNKFIAKMSTQINKPQGITITKPGDFLKTFGHWELTKFHGIGRPTARKLNQIGIKTIGQLAQSDVKKITQVVGVAGTSYWLEANEQSSDQLDASHNELKSIGNSMTFHNKNYSNRQEILNMIGQMVQLVSHRAQKRNLVGHVVAIAIKTAGGKEIKARSKQNTLAIPINKYQDIFKTAQELFDQLWRGETIKFVGVTLTKLKNIFETSFQSSLFDQSDNRNDVEKIISLVNNKHQQKVIMTAYQGLKQEYKKQNQSRYLESDRALKYYDLSEK